MEYIYKKTGKIIANAREMENVLKEVYTEDMFEVSLTKNRQPVSLGGVFYVYGTALRAIDEPRFKKEYEGTITSSPGPMFKDARAM